MSFEKKSYKSKIARSFDKSAKYYHLYDKIQDIGSGNLAVSIQRKIDQADSKSDLKILDIGAGNGRLISKIDAKDLLALDISFEMLNALKEKNPDIQTIQADATLLPFKRFSIDILISSMMLQWIKDLDRFFSEATRIVKVGGSFFSVSLSEGTFIELENCILNVLKDLKIDRKIRKLHKFHSVSSMVEAAFLSSFELVSEKTQKLIEHYESVESFLKNLKGIGASTGFELSFLSIGERRTVMKRFIDLYNRLYKTDDNKIAVTYTISYLEFIKTVDKFENETS